MHEDEIGILRACLEESGSEVIVAHGILADPTVEVESGSVTDPNAPDELAAFIGFSSELLRGTVTLVAPVALMRQAYPLCRPSDVSIADVHDWTGEIVNQLMGRLKNKLCARGLVLFASTPKTVHAWQLAVGTSARSSVCSLHFRSGAAGVRVHFDALAPLGAVLFPPGAKVESCAVEGGAELF